MLFRRAKKESVSIDLEQRLAVARVDDAQAGEASRIDADARAQMQAIYRSQAVIEFDLTGKILTANENFLSLMGYELDEIVGEHHRLFVTPEECRSADYGSFWERLRAGEYFSAEFHRVAKHGRDIWIRGSYNPIYGPDGKPYKVVKFALDVTEQKLLDADHASQIAAINKVQAVITFNLDGIILSANEIFLSTVGYSLSEIVGKHHRMFVLPAEAQSVEYIDFWDELRAGTFQSRVFSRLNKKQEIVWLQASYNPIVNAAGKIVKIVKYANNVTEIIEHTERTSRNVHSVAAASEEINASINEINRNVVLSKEASTAISQKANKSSNSANDLMATAQSMEKIVELIRTIAGQVNLLALNATIEAARAGEAGRGFAVVAGEVKSLANKTSQATDEIAAKISSIQSVSVEVADGISDTLSKVDEVNGYMAHLAAAVDQQAGATRDISHNAHESSEAVEKIMQKMKQVN